MTTPYERTRSVLQAKEFLQMLALAKEQEIPEQIRREAQRLLRHFPDKGDLQFAANTCPEWWGPPEPK